MRNLEAPTPGLGRRELEEFWRLRFETMREQYEMATARYRKLLKESPEGPTSRPDDPLAIARQDESQALAEYAHILKIFTALTVNGRIPEQEAAAGEEEERR